MLLLLGGFGAALMNRTKPRVTPLESNANDVASFVKQGSLELPGHEESRLGNT